MTTFKWQKTSFGDNLSFEGLPKDTDLLIVCVLFHGAKPKTLLLPHQLYRQDLIDLAERYPDSKGFYVMPCSSKNWIELPLELLKDE